jgi:DnaD/phage-associated family protein
MELEQGRFEGFPAGALATTIPNLFFTAVLPHISDPAELVVSLYFFFAHGRKKGQPRFLTYAELAADHVLAAALDSLGEGALGRGLNAAVERGTLLRVDAGQAQELYFLNTPAGRRAAAAIEADEQELGRLLPRATEPPEVKPNIFELYEQNIGPLTPMVAEYLKDAEEQYPADWFEPAFQRAVENNKRSWSYIAAILRRWEAEGPDYEKAGRDLEGPGRKRSLSGRYRHLVRH